MYPSRETEEPYRSSDPVLLTGIVASAFLFTTLLFIAYDHLVEHRQKVVMNRAARSSAIVSSLFPENVRNRMYEEAENQEKGVVSPTTAASTSEMRESGTDEDRRKNTIADAFPNTTVLFADLKGFTKWSSGRSPSDVFFLLETLYFAFDGLADRHQVFKVCV